MLGLFSRSQQLSLCCVEDVELLQAHRYSVDKFSYSVPLGILGPNGYKTFLMLNSAEHEMYPANKCYDANNCRHFNIY